MILFVYMYTGLEETLTESASSFLVLEWLATKVATILPRCQGCAFFWDTKIFFCDATWCWLTQSTKRSCTFFLASSDLSCRSPVRFRKQMGRMRMSACWAWTFSLWWRWLLAWHPNPNVSPRAAQWPLTSRELSSQSWLHFAIKVVPQHFYESWATQRVRRLVEVDSRIRATVCQDDMPTCCRVSSLLTSRVVSIFQKKKKVAFQRYGWESGDVLGDSYKPTQRNQVWNQNTFSKQLSHCPSVVFFMHQRIHRHRQVFLPIPTLSTPL